MRATWRHCRGSTLMAYLLWYSNAVVTLNAVSTDEFCSKFSSRTEAGLPRALEGL